MAETDAEAGPLADHADGPVHRVDVELAGLGEDPVAVALVHLVVGVEHVAVARVANCPILGQPLPERDVFGVVVAVEDLVPDPSPIGHHTGIGEHSPARSGLPGTASPIRWW